MFFITCTSTVFFLFLTHNSNETCMQCMSAHVYVALKIRTSFGNHQIQIFLNYDFE